LADGNILTFPLSVPAASKDQTVAI